MEKATNLHATALVIGDRGILIQGASGSGKTSLAAELLHRAAVRNVFARMVSDDQVFAHVVSGRLIVEAPASIRGLVELYGIGPRAIPTVDRAVIDLFVQLSDDSPRYQELQRQPVSDAMVNQVVLRSRSTVGSAHAILSLLADEFGGKS